MNKENGIVKVPFYGSEIIVVNKRNQKYVVARSLSDGIGLEWRSQRELLKRDPVLSSVATLAGVTGDDGSVCQMICLPLEYLNGWLFRIPASRYKGKKREAVIRYQLECYQTLHAHFFRDAASHSSVNLEQINAVLTGLLEKLDEKDKIIRDLKQECQTRRDLIILCPQAGNCGKHKAKKSRTCMRGIFGFFKGGR